MAGSKHAHAAAVAAGSASAPVPAHSSSVAPPDATAPRGALSSLSQDSSSGSGPSETTLIVYSIFMAATSLLFGGLSLIHAHSGSSTDPTASYASRLLALLPSPAHWARSSFKAASQLHTAIVGAMHALHSIDITTLLWTAAGLLTILSVALWTNPSDASFRTFLADLSLHQHLRQLHDEAPPDTPPLSSLTPREATAASHDAEVARAVGASDMVASPHVLTFANRISISLRTPPYRRTDLGLFTVVSVTHVPSEAQRGPGGGVGASTFSPRRPAQDGTVECAHCGTVHAAGSATQKSWFVGAFGRWFGGTLSCALDTTRLGEKPAAETARSSSPARLIIDGKQMGVLDMQAHDAEAGEEQARKGEKLITMTSSKESSAKIAALNDTPDDPAPPLPPPSKSSKRRKKHPQRPRPSQPPPGREASAADRRTSPDTEKPPAVVASAEAAVALDPSHSADSTHVTSKAPQHPSKGPASSTTTASQSSPIAALTSTLTSANAAVQELQLQLEQHRFSSEATRQQLQTQLDELRARKREEDAMRLDLRGRMKSLDESKRQAEAGKREAERRLKAAVGLREAIEARIKAKADEIVSLREREVDNVRRVQESATRRVDRGEEIELEIQAKHEAQRKAERDVEELNAKLARLEERLMEEEINLEASREYAAERHRSMMHDAALESNYFAQHAHQYAPHHQHHLQQQHQHPSSSSLNQIYPLLSGPSEHTSRSAAEDVFGSPPYDSAWMHEASMYAPMYAGDASRLHAAEGHEAAAFDPTFNSTAPNDYSPFFSAPAAQPHIPFAEMLGGGGAGAADGLHNRRGVVMGDLSGAMTPPRAASGYAAQADVPTTPFTPLSPFSTTLLPSNLFQNADDDENHVGILPGTRNERVEAALGRFGLDTSDTSSIEADGIEEDDEAQYVVAPATAVQQAKVQAIPINGNGATDSDADDEPDDFESSGPKSRKESGRSWWGGRSRGASKDGTAIAAAAAQAAALTAEAKDDDAPLDSDGTKRRSLSIFPKLSLNPGAKAFRSSSRKQASDASAAARAQIRGPLDAWPLASGPTQPTAVPTDYDAVRRAFDTHLGADEEEQGRRSWSAFDTWAHQGQHSLAQQSHASSRLSLLGQEGSGPSQHHQQQQQHGRHPYGFASGGLGERLNAAGRSSSDSLPHARWMPSTSSNDSFNPLARTTSQPSVTSSSPSHAESARRSAGGGSRFAFNPFKNGSESSSTAAAADVSSSSNGRQSTPSRHANNNNDNTGNEVASSAATEPDFAAQPAAGATQGDAHARSEADSPQKTKRSFRW